MLVLGLLPPFLPVLHLRSPHQAEEKGRCHPPGSEGEEGTEKSTRPLLVPVDSGVNTRGDSDESEAIVRGAMQWEESGRAMR